MAIGRSNGHGSRERRLQRGARWLVWAALALLSLPGVAAAESNDPADSPPDAPDTSASTAAPATTPPASPPARETTPLAGLPAVPNVPSPAAITRAAAAWKAHVDGGTRDLKAGRWRAAEDHFRAALVLDPSDPARLGQLAASLDGAGARRRAAIPLRQAVALTADLTARGARWADVARNAEARALSTDALDAWRRAQSLAPDPAIAARIAELRKLEPVPLMSPRSLCPSLLDAWGCAPSTRPGDGDLRCSCEIERLERTPAALVGGIRGVDDFGISTFDDRTLLAAALVRVRGAGMALLDTYYLAVETGSGGWQMVGRAIEGWQPGAAYTAREGALIEMGFRDLGDVAAHGPVLVVRMVNRVADGDFSTNSMMRGRGELLVVCHAEGSPICVSTPIAKRLEMRAMRADGPAPKLPGDTDWAVETRFDRDGTLVVTSRRGQLPPETQPLIGTHGLATLTGLPGAWAIPLR